MKKLLSLILIAGTFSFMSCGPSKEEQEAAQKATEDSLAQVAAAEAQKATEDSLAMVQKAIEDSITAANQQAMQDSLAAIQEKMSKMERKMNAKPPVKSNEKKEEEDRASQKKEKG